MEDKEAPLVRIPKMLTERDVLKMEHDMVGEVMEWGVDDAGNVNPTSVHYLYGVYDMTSKILREIGE